MISTKFSRAFTLSVERRLLFTSLIRAFSANHIYHSDFFMCSTFYSFFSFKVERWYMSTIWSGTLFLISGFRSLLSAIFACPNWSDNQRFLMTNQISSFQILLLYPNLPYQYIICSPFSCYIRYSGMWKI